jgi:hypothetical protein
MYVSICEIEVDHGIRERILTTEAGSVVAIRYEKASRTTKHKILAVPLGLWHDLLKPWAFSHQTVYRGMGSDDRLRNFQLV